MTYVEFNLIRVISAGIITAAISTAYCSFAYLLHGPLLKSHLSLEPFVITKKKENKRRQSIWHVWQMTHPSTAL